MFKKFFLLRRAGILFLGFLAAVIILEAGLRLGGLAFSAVEEYRNRKAVKRAGIYRILCLGESTTRRAYPPFLEKILNQKKTGIRFTVIDAGQAGVRTETILLQLEDNLKKYQPHIVIAMMGCNDQGTLYFKEIPDANTWLFRHSRAYQLLRMICRQVSGKISPKKIINLKGRRESRETSQAVLTNFAGVGEDILSREVGGRMTDKSASLNLQERFSYYPLGSAYLDKSRFSELERFAKETIGCEPGNDALFLQLGWLYLDNLQYAEAEQAFRKATALNSRNRAAFMEIGRLCLRQKRFREAKWAFEKAIKIDPLVSSAFSDLGLHYCDQGDFEQAEALFQKALALSPADDRCYGRLALVYSELGKQERFDFYAEKANHIKNEHFDMLTLTNYLRLKRILDQKKIRLVCMQYPMRSIQPLRKFFESEPGPPPIFVDNEGVFMNAVRHEGYKAYFLDMFGGNFGHCTRQGNELLAENIANVIMKEVFARK